MAAPSACSAGMISRLGAARMSSVFGLKVKPSTARVLPRTEPPQVSITRRAMLFLRSSLTATTVSTIRTPPPASRAV